MMTIDSLFQSLQQRRRPEDVAELVARELAGSLTRSEGKLLDQAARGALRRQVVGYTSMAQDFARPRGLAPQVGVARKLFTTAKGLRAAGDDPAALRRFVARLAAEIGKAVGASDFKYHRLNAEARASAGITDSRRRYNRKFRLLRRLEGKIEQLARQLEQVDLTMIGKSGLATRIPYDAFVQSGASASFIAYFVARANLRSEFTIAGQPRALDEIAAMLFARCERDPGTSWWAIAHVYPVDAVLARLSADEQLRLMASWLSVLHRVSELLEETWTRSGFNLATMTVRRGDDSTTWNQLAGAWNKARDGWMALTYALGAEDLLDAACPGKVMRLVAGDLAAWHRSVGHGVEPNTQVWSSLPAPWKVLRGQARCTRAMVEAACRRAGLDPGKSGWVAPRPAAHPVAFRPTPELVHGVIVDNPHLAAFLRQAGWFAGKAAAVRGPDVVVVADDAAGAAGADVEIVN
jgi:hypothetical protein